jgi:hypothetical protein
VQVKTNRKSANFWLLSAHAAHLKSDSHIYVFVNIGKRDRPEFIAAPSVHVAAKMITSPARTGAVFYEFRKADRPSDSEGWELFGDAHAGADAVDVPDELQL